jgi:hypothetical protein
MARSAKQARSVSASAVIRFAELSRSPFSIIAMIRLVISGDSKFTPDIINNAIVAMTRYLAHGPANRNSLISFLIKTPRPKFNNQ